MKKYQEIFSKLWDIYTKQNPQALKIYNLFTERGEQIVNDHIAFRTFDDERVNIDILAKPFLNSGYGYIGDYHFEEKKLYAKHFAHKTDRTAPRVFISQLLSSKFSPFLQEKVTEIISKIPQSALESEKLIYSGTVWGKVSFEIYEKLRKESEYAAWLYVNGFRANHFTVSINNLKIFNGIAEVNKFLKENDLLINNSGGEIKGSPEELLEQSSTKAEKEPVHFIEGTYEIPASYYEFAMRYLDKSGKIYDGFIAKSADKIFESTDFYKK